MMILDCVQKTFREIPAFSQHASNLLVSNIEELFLTLIKQNALFLAHRVGFYEICRKELAEDHFSDVVDQAADKALFLILVAQEFCY